MLKCKRKLTGWFYNPNYFKQTVLSAPERAEEYVEKIELASCPEIKKNTDWLISKVNQIIFIIIPQ